MIWVCVDCMLAHHGYTEHELGYVPETEPWALWDAPIDVSAGGACSDPEDCPWDGECDMDTFSKSPCDGCGSTLAGERHAFTYWTGDRA